MGTARSSGGPGEGSTTTILGNPLVASVVGGIGSYLLMQGSLWISGDVTSVVLLVLIGPVLGVITIGGGFLLRISYDTMRRNLLGPLWKT